LAYLRTDTPSSITPYMVMLLDPPADDDDPDVPAQPAHTTTSSVNTMIFNICILDTTAPFRRTTILARGILRSHRGLALHRYFTLR
jgi:hypothetical protein